MVVVSLARNTAAKACKKFKPQIEAVVASSGILIE
jgi:hypothetical protein